VANHCEQIGNREGFRQVAYCAASQARFACRVASSAGYDDDRQAGKNMKLWQSDAAVSVGQDYVQQYKRKPFFYDAPQAIGDRVFDSQRESLSLQYCSHDPTETHIIVNHEDTDGLRMGLLVWGWNQ
jgi:hypothetical protein